jgi:hypothetical protein
VTGGDGSAIGGSNSIFPAREATQVVILKIDLEAAEGFSAK